MLEHHLQREILNTLVTTQSARFAELKPGNIDGNIFTYHLQQLIKQKLVAKQEDGSYCLTQLGKAAGINLGLTPAAILQQAHSVLFMAARDSKGRWLLRRRRVHPTYGKLGFVHGEPVGNEAITDTAAHIFEQRTGLKAMFSPRGDGYIRIFHNSEQESFTHFTLLLAENVSGEPIPSDRSGENSWLENPDFAAEDMIPSMEPLVKALESKNFFFLDLQFDL